MVSICRSDDEKRFQLCPRFISISCEDMSHELDGEHSHDSKRASIAFSLPRPVSLTPLSRIQTYGGTLGPSSYPSFFFLVGSVSKMRGKNSSGKSREVLILS